MAITALDTHQTVKDLTAAGFTDAQAEALAYALRQSQQLDLSQLATKTDLVEVRREMAEIKADLIKWMIGMTFAGGGAVVALVRLVVGATRNPI
ncbi:MAG TPA: hypothetical protein VG651_12355 [Stellaceae bacterium]|nr:hypothetical protein [Stellaceae bacterium]